MSELDPCSLAALEARLNALGVPYEAFPPGPGFPAPSLAFSRARVAMAGQGYVVRWSLSGRASHAVSVAEVMSLVFAGRYLGDD